MGPTKLVMPVRRQRRSGPVLVGRPRAARPAVRGDRPAAPREGAGDPLPRRALIEHGRADRRRARGGLRPRSRRRTRTCRRPFERKLLHFRPFGRDMKPEEEPKEPAAEEEAAADAPAADGPRSGAGTWQPPRPPAGTSAVPSGSSGADRPPGRLGYRSPRPSGRAWAAEGSGTRRSGVTSHRARRPSAHPASAGRSASRQVPPAVGRAGSGRPTGRAAIAIRPGRAIGRPAIGPGRPSGHVGHRATPAMGPAASADTRQ